MFSMGRFDPTMEMEPEVKKSNSPSEHEHNYQGRETLRKGKSLKRKNSDSPPSAVNDRKRKLPGDNQREETIFSTAKTEGEMELQCMNAEQNEDVNDSSGSGKSNSSSSVPSTEDESSSSAPSSDESDEDEDKEGDGDEEKPVMKVIAPEQKYMSNAGTRRKLQNISDEGMDDFDFDQSEGSFATNSNGNKKYNREVETALRLSKIHIQDAAKLWNLAPFLLENLQRDAYENFFPIQALVIPDVIASERHAHIQNRDICVSAPTGSGKTLAFVLPVLNSLARRRIRRLRALVVLPSRDLAKQVYEVYERYSKGSNLKIGLSIGQTDFTSEQSSLIIGRDGMDDSQESRRLIHALQPFSIKHALQAFNGISTDADKKFSSLEGCWAYGDLKDRDGLCATPNGGSSTVDVLVCTPGRLIAHLDSTPGFTLQHLRFLVIDEADRLMNQSYNNWIHRVMMASATGPQKLMSDMNQVKSRNMKRLDPVTWRRDQGNLGPSHDADLAAVLETTVCRPLQLRKLLFSATMTKDPRKLASLGLVNPKHFDAHHLTDCTLSESMKNSGASKTSYSLPQSLRESIIECTAEQKPLVLLAVLLEQDLIDKNNGQEGIAVIFTSSVDSTHRLTRLLQLLYASAGFGPTTSVGEFSSALTQKQRAKLMEQCNNPSKTPSRIRVIVCSDGMSRGMDISSVTTVINYDVPSFAKTYVHRCGRTARAGRSGRAVTIMKGGQITKFMKMRALIDNPNNVNDTGVKKDLVKNAVPIYKKCVRALRRILDAEQNDGLSPVSPLGENWIH